MIENKLIIEKKEKENLLAGLAIPVFSLRTQHNLGVGSFLDLKLLADFMHKTGMSVIQLLPIQDTTIHMNYTDSSPYSVLSSFALHPLYFDVTPFIGEFTTEQWSEYARLKEELHDKNEVDYERTLHQKWYYAMLLYKKLGTEIFGSPEFQEYFETHQTWLKPYSVFCSLRDIYATSDFHQWKDTHQIYSKELYAQLLADEHLTELIELNQFMQFLLHQQLVEASDYCHSKGVILKGDIPVGIMKNSVDAWVNPDLYNMDMQAGAPPDQFSTTGQNWGFPTYNWSKMAEDDYAWWKSRLTTMAEYFDAYRLDHILGFFRIWEILETSVRGMLGHFSPALGFSADEIESWGIPFRPWGIERFLEPFIKDFVLDEIFGSENRTFIIQNFLDIAYEGGYKFKEEYNTQKKIEQLGEMDDVIRDGLYTLHENVIFVVDHKNPELYHPRIEFIKTSSFKEFGYEFQEKMHALHDHYYYHRNYDFWADEARQKLPAIIHATDMLSCGEDLGMVPANVPDVMNELGILSLKLERIPTNGQWFTDITKAPYLSVVTTSSHDTTTLRLLWEEEPDFANRYYYDLLGLEGEVPKELTGKIAVKIIKRNLESPSMLVALPFQDWLAIDEKLRIADPSKERINQPGVANHYWRYRMHLDLEELIDNEEFILQVRGLVEKSNRHRK
ncbi:MAG: 4-alpha-glucanotransferase [Streptococcaceae bacterium]|jgi:4-alpha-glucanotransferase|nr:4-alpha-glucanotransferase [Streptococcaceae bacterium]